MEKFKVLMKFKEGECEKEFDDQEVAWLYAKMMKYATTIRIISSTTGTIYFRH